MKSPEFSSRLIGDAIVLTAVEHECKSDVLFGMFRFTVMNAYNVSVPKEENIDLGPAADDAVQDRLVVSELPSDETIVRMNSLIRGFQSMCAELEQVSGRQLPWLADYAKLRLSAA